MSSSVLTGAKSKTSELSFQSPSRHRCNTSYNDLKHLSNLSRLFCHLFPKDRSKTRWQTRHTYQYRVSHVTSQCFSFIGKCRHTLLFTYTYVQDLGDSELQAQYSELRLACTTFFYGPTPHGHKASANSQWLKPWLLCRRTCNGSSCYQASSTNTDEGWCKQHCLKLATSPRL